MIEVLTGTGCRKGWRGCRCYTESCSGTPARCQPGDWGQSAASSGCMTSPTWTQTWPWQGHPARRPRPLGSPPALRRTSTAVREEPKRGRITSVWLTHSTRTISKEKPLKYIRTCNNKQGGGGLAPPLFSKINFSYIFGNGIVMILIVAIVNRFFKRTDFLVSPPFWEFYV